MGKHGRKHAPVIIEQPSYSGLLQKGEFTDIAVIVGSKHKKTFHLHKNIISLHSEKFKKHCSGEADTIHLTDMDIETFQDIIIWMYQGKCKLPFLNNNRLDIDQIVAVYIAADFLMISPLKTALIKAIQEDIFGGPGGDRLSVQDVVSVLTAMFPHSTSKEKDKIGEAIQMAIEGFHADVWYNYIKKDSHPDIKIYALLAGFWAKKVDSLFCRECSLRNFKPDHCIRCARRLG